MIFARSVPGVTYADITRYRPRLRRDFRFRCAYCLTHEFYLGGEAGCEIDHHRPRRGRFARPDLAAVYENLYWVCRECNQNKSDTWPTDDEYSRGQRFLDPCRETDDHDAHWITRADGQLVLLTPTGQYTVENLLLWREQLMFLRARCHQWQRESLELHRLLDTHEVTAAQRLRIEQRLADLAERIEPPTFNRPHR